MNVGNHGEVRQFLVDDTGFADRLRESIVTRVRTFRFDPTLEEALVEETLGRLFLTARAGRIPDGTSVTTHADQMARTLCLRSLEPHSGAGPPPRSGGEHAENFRRFGRLSPDCREFLALILLDRLPRDEIARRLGLTERDVRIRLEQCRLSGAVVRGNE